MKKITIILITIITLGGMVNETKAQGHGGISFTTFYNELSPYGRWVMDPQYGQVWIADAPGFEPYYDNGRWVYTSYGWTWASDYPWGWAPFHYGRWTYLPMWGWAWVPGYQWGPAWVGWCQNDGYFGWAPLSPGMGFNFSYNSMPYNYWRFVPQQYITGPSFHNHIIRPVREQNEFRKMNIINNMQVNNQVTYLAGPRREAVERVTRERITARPVAFTGTDERTRVYNKEVRMYRPDLKPNNSAATNHPADQRRDELQQNRQPTAGNPNTAVKPLPNVVTPPATVVQPTVKQPAEPITRRDDRAVKPLPVAPKQDNQTAMDEQPLNRLPNERQLAREEMEKNRSLRTAPQQQDERRLQRVQEQLQREQQMQAQREQQQNELQAQRARQEQLRQQQVQEQKLQQQQAMQQQNEQRLNEMRQQQLQAQKEQQLREQQQQNEIRRQQLQEQRMQQRMMQQQQSQQRQNEIRQQRMQEAPMRPQREMPVNQRPRSGKPNEN